MKTILFAAVSVNGMIADERGEEDFLSEENWAAFAALAGECGNVIWGRKAYEQVRSWGGRYLEDMRGIAKIIVSEKGLVFLDGFDLASSPQEALAKLKGKGFEQALVAGGSRLNASFAREGLLNEIVLDMSPAVIGRGVPVFAPENFQFKLALLDTTPIAGGIVRQRYKVLKSKK